MGAFTACSALNFSVNRARQCSIEGEATAGRFRTRRKWRNGWVCIIFEDVKLKDHQRNDNGDDTETERDHRGVF